MTAGLLRALLRLVLEDADLLAEQVLVDVRGHGDLGERVGVDQDVVTGGREQDRRRERRAGLVREAVDGQVLALADAVLLSAERDDGKHKGPSIDWLGRKRGHAAAAEGKHTE